ncbi:class E sortase [Streptomyces sp. NPDC051561]|uniref:class E sortase n=1 Tax=Streptomyces sp. NPDC051561 TaxID=3365658 RepID=UPI0037A6BD1A
MVLLMLVVHQLWWTNREAKGGAEETVQALVREWGEGEEGGEVAGRQGGAEVGVGETEGGAGVEPEVGETAGSEPVGEGARPPRGSGGVGKVRKVGPPRWDQAYAVMRIPKVGVVAPVAQGVGKRGVLDKGYIGHYPGTAQPGQPGNFAVAGHRNTHGEPFRYINRLGKGDEVEVETRDAVYTYVVSGGVAQTSERDVAVIGDVPRSEVKPGLGYREPGYYLTLTTCTPEFTSKYRLVVWGKLARMRPR